MRSASPGRTEVTPAQWKTRSTPLSARRTERRSLTSSRTRSQSSSVDGVVGRAVAHAEHDLVAALDRKAGDVRADEPGRAGDDYAASAQIRVAGGAGPRSGAGSPRQRTASGTASSRSGGDLPAARQADAVGAVAERAARFGDAPLLLVHVDLRRLVELLVVQLAARDRPGGCPRAASSESRDPRPSAASRRACCVSSSARASRRASICLALRERSSLHLRGESRGSRLPRAWPASRWSRTAPPTSRRELVERHGIHVVPLYIVFGGDRTVPETDITDYHAFFEELRGAESLPTTSQPSVGDFTSVYEPLLADGGEVVSVHISGGLSGTPESARHAGRDARARGQGRRARRRCSTPPPPPAGSGSWCSPRRSAAAAGAPAAEIVDAPRRGAAASCSCGSPSTRSSSCGAAAASAPPAPGSARRCGSSRSSPSRTR